MNKNFYIYLEKEHKGVFVYYGIGRVPHFFSGAPLVLQPFLPNPALFYNPTHQHTFVLQPYPSTLSFMTLPMLVFIHYDIDQLFSYSKFNA